jgi:hypothetical protein
MTYLFKKSFTIALFKPPLHVFTIGKIFDS